MVELGYYAWVSVFQNLKRSYREQLEVKKKSMGKFWAKIKAGEPRPGNLLTCIWLLWALIHLRGKDHVGGW